MKYRDAASFRQALEQRINNQSKGQSTSLARCRRTITGERLLARFAAVRPDALLLKGGFALEMRLADRARVTRDIDIAWQEDRAELIDTLQEAADYDAADFFHYRFERDTAPEDRFGGSDRFRVTAELAGRSFDRFVMDIGFDSVSTDDVEILITRDSMAFAEVPRAAIKAVSLERHLAEKVHAYTRVYIGARQNTRVKDLVDMVLIAGHFQLDGSSLGRLLATTFKNRAAQPLPAKLPLPPRDWATSFARLAAEVGVPAEIGHGHSLVASLLDPVLAGASGDARWDPKAAGWTSR